MTRAGGRDASVAPLPRRARGHNSSTDRSACGLPPGRTQSDGVGSWGQAVVEFALVLPVFLTILLGVLEFGLLFTHRITLEYATREGARAGSALANGHGDPGACSSIDPQIVAAVERVLHSPGSPIELAMVSGISIWRADASGAPVPGAVNEWAYSGPDTGPVVDGQRLSFSEVSQAWAPCSRVNSPVADSIGVGLRYRYRMLTPLSGLAHLFGPGATDVPMTDGTVMALNP